jgi:hypothetical protein
MARRFAKLFVTIALVIPLAQAAVVVTHIAELQSGDHAFLNCPQSTDKALVLGVKEIPKL